MLPMQRLGEADSRHPAHNQVMTTSRTAVEDADVPDPFECWCCGKIQAPDVMVHLGTHPEVALCTGCTRWVNREGRAIEDRSRTGLGVRVRNGLRIARSQVAQRGWHRKGVIGRPLQWIGRRLP